MHAVLGVCALYSPRRREKHVRNSPEAVHCVLHLYSTPAAPSYGWSSIAEESRTAVTKTAVVYFTSVSFCVLSIRAPT